MGKIANQFGVVDLSQGELSIQLCNEFDGRLEFFRIGKAKFMTEFGAALFFGYAAGQIINGMMKNLYKIYVYY